MLDTDVLIDVLRGREAARLFLQDMADRFVPCCSVISVAELYVGMRPEEESATRSFLDGLVIIPVTQEIAEVAGRFKKRSVSHRLELANCLIAAMPASPRDSARHREYRCCREATAACHSNRTALAPRQFPTTVADRS